MNPIVVAAQACQIVNGLVRVPGHPFLSRLTCNVCRRGTDLLQHARDDDVFSRVLFQPVPLRGLSGGGGKGESDRSDAVLKTALEEESPVGVWENPNEGASVEASLHAIFAKRIQPSFSAVTVLESELTRGKAF